MTKEQVEQRKCEMMKKRAWLNTIHNIGANHHLDCILEDRQEEKMNYFNAIRFINNHDELIMRYCPINHLKWSLEYVLKYEMNKNFSSNYLWCCINLYEISKREKEQL